MEFKKVDRSLAEAWRISAWLYWTRAVASAGVLLFVLALEAPFVPGGDPSALTVIFSLGLIFAALLAVAAVLLLVSHLVQMLVFGSGRG